MLGQALLSPKVAKFSTRDKIVEILSQKWPLSIKEIYQELIRVSGKDITYQAVHKKILLLEEDCIISRNGKRFELNRNWISEIKSFVQKIDERYKNNHIGFEDSKNGMALSFPDYSTCVLTIANLFANQSFIKPGLDTTPIGIFNHLWWTLRFDFAHFDLLLKVVKRNAGGYVIAKGNAPFDRWVKQQYLRAGFKGVKTAVPLDNHNDDFFVHGNHVIQVNFSKETQDFLDEFYSKTTGITDLFASFLKQEEQKRKLRIEAKIIENPERANLLREQVKSHFNGVKK